MKANDIRYLWWPAIALFAVILACTVAGCSRDERAYEKAKSTDSIESWSDFIQRHANSAHAEEARERITYLEQIQAIQKLLEGKDAVAKTKVILQLQKMPKDALAVQLVPALIATVSDETSVQIPENLLGADVRLNSQFGRGSVLMMREGDMFPSDTGVVIAGKNAALRVSTPGDEARAVLVRMAGQDFGADVAKWNEWWAQHRKNKSTR